MQNEIDFGIEVEAFLQGPIGLYLVTRAEEEIAEALEALKNVDSEDPKLIRALQNQIFRCEAVQYWLAEAIQSGLNEQRELHEKGDFE